MGVGVGEGGERAVEEFGDNVTSGSSYQTAEPGSAEAGCLPGWAVPCNHLVTVTAVPPPLGS